MQQPSTARLGLPVAAGQDAVCAALRGRLANLPTASAPERHRLRETLLKELAASYMPLRALAAEGLGRIGDERAVTPLIRALHDPAPLVQWRAAHALQMLHTRALVPADRLAFQDGAAFTGWKIDLLNRLIAALGDPAVPVRLEAVTSLGEIGVPETLPALLTAAFDSEAPVRWEVGSAIVALITHHPDLLAMVHNTLVPVLTAGDPLVRRTVVDLLGRLEDHAVVPDLLPLLHDPDAGVRWSTCEALGILRDLTTTHALAGRLVDDDLWVRRSSAEALGRLADPYAVLPLIHSGADESPLVRRAVFRALGRIGAPAAQPLLIRALQDPDAAARLEAIQALERTGDGQALKPLAALAHDDTLVGGLPISRAVAGTRTAIADRLRRPR